MPKTPRRTPQSEGREELEAWLGYFSVDDPGIADEFNYQEPRGETGNRIALIRLATARKKRAGTKTTTRKK